MRRGRKPHPLVDGYYTIPECAARLEIRGKKGVRTGSSVRIIERYIESGRLPSVLKGVRLVSVKDFVRFNQTPRKIGRPKKVKEVSSDTVSH